MLEFIDKMGEPDFIGAARASSIYFEEGRVSRHQGYGWNFTRPRDIGTVVGRKGLHPSKVTANNEIRCPVGFVNNAGVGECTLENRI